MDTETRLEQDDNRARGWVVGIGSRPVWHRAGRVLRHEVYLSLCGFEGMCGGMAEYPTPRTHNLQTGNESGVPLDARCPACESAFTAEQTFNFVRINSTWCRLNENGRPMCIGGEGPGHTDYRAFSSPHFPKCSDVPAGESVCPECQDIFIGTRDESDLFYRSGESCRVGDIVEFNNEKMGYKWAVERICSPNRHEACRGGPHVHNDTDTTWGEPGSVNLVSRSASEPTSADETQPAPVVGVDLAIPGTERQVTVGVDTTTGHTVPLDVCNPERMASLLAARTDRFHRAAREPRHVLRGITVTPWDGHSEP